MYILIIQNLEFWSIDAIYRCWYNEDVQVDGKEMFNIWQIVHWEFIFVLNWMKKILYHIEVKIN